MDDLFALHDNGIFLRREALALGYDDHTLRLSHRHGVIHRVRHGAYVRATTWRDADALERHRLRCHAALAVHAPGTVALSHTSALVMHRIDVWEPDLRFVHLTRLDGHTARNRADARYHFGTLEPEHLVVIDGALTTAPARAGLEHASLVDVPHGVVALDAVLAAGLGAGIDEELRAVAATIANWPNMARVQLTARLARPGAQSVGESVSRMLMWQFHLPEPVLQFHVYDERTGELLGITDFAWPRYRLLGEFDGRLKYGRLLRAGETPGDAVFAEKRREDRLREATGWGMIRMVWDDVLLRPNETADRLRRALGQHAA